MFEIPPGVEELLKLGLTLAVGGLAVGILPDIKPRASRPMRVAALWAIAWVLGRLIVGTIAVGARTSLDPNEMGTMIAGLGFVVVPCGAVLLSRRYAERLPEQKLVPITTPRAAWTDNFALVGWILMGLFVCFGLLQSRTPQAFNALAITILLIEGLRILRVHANVRAVLLPLLALLVSLDSGALTHSELGFGWRRHWLEPAPLLFIVAGLRWARSGDRFSACVLGTLLTIPLMFGGLAAILAACVFALAGLIRRGLFRPFAVLLGVAALIGAGFTYARMQNLEHPPDKEHPYGDVMGATPRMNFGWRHSGTSYGILVGSVIRSGRIDGSNRTAEDVVEGLGERTPERIEQVHHEATGAAIAVGLCGLLVGLRTALRKRSFDLRSRVWLIVLPILVLCLEPALLGDVLSQEWTGIGLWVGAPAILLLGIWMLTPHDEPVPED